MKQLLTLFLTVTLGVLAGNACAQMPSKVFRQLMKTPAEFPAYRFAQLSNKQLAQLTSRLERDLARVNRQNELERAVKARVFETSRPAVFRVISKEVGSYHSLSGTLFKITYDGKTEIFGAIPMHVLKDSARLSGMIDKEFSAALQTQEGMKVLPAQVVQLSSSKTGNVALVKFQPEDEPLLSPLMLSRAHFTQFPKPAYAQGYARSILTQSRFPLVGTTSGGKLVAQLPAAYAGERTGFCGSPVLTQNATLAGIHVGSTYLSQELQEDASFAAFHLPNPEQNTGDIGYITPVSFLRKLVENYHEPSSKPLSIQLAGQEIARLAVDEYVSQIELLDEHLNVLWLRNTRFKVSFSAAEAAISLFPQAAFVRLQIGKTHWVQDEKGWFVQDTDDVSSLLKPLVRP